MPSIFTFGWKYGGPEERFNWRGVVIDARTLKNPYHDRKLRQLNGKHDAVQAEIKRSINYDNVLERVSKILRQGQDVMIGCHAGRHRSVALGELASKIHKCEVLHLDEMNWLSSAKVEDQC